jgi:hypothetical protein
MHTVELQIQLIEVDWELDQLAFEAFAVTETERRVVEDTVGPHPIEVTKIQDSEGLDVTSGSDDLQRVHRVSRFQIEDLARRQGCSPRSLINLSNGYPIEKDIEAGARELVSFLFGVAIGRWRPPDTLNAEREPADAFSAMTVCPALSNSIGRILVDDEGHPSDVISTIFDVLSQAGVSDPAQAADDIGLLAQLNGGLRSWLSREFFKGHISAYSASQRKAPVYRQISVPSARYSIWIYFHSVTQDTFYTVQRTFLVPKIAHEEKRLAGLKDSAGANPSAHERKQIAAVESLLVELHAFLEEVKCITPIWNPVLDDGVLLTMAPLWRLFPHQKPWQKELKNKWDDLAAGKFDWARIAMKFWPERVLPKCATDRSLAVAHELEDILWQEGDDGKWSPRKNPKRLIDELVLERTSVAIKAALKGLGEASEPSVPKTKMRRSKL